MQSPKVLIKAMEDLLYKIGITQIPMVGAVTARSLVAYCGGARAVFEARKRELLCIPGIGERTAQSILDQQVLHLAEAELRFIEKHHIQPLFYLDEDYPVRLKPFPDSPVMLYYKGSCPLNALRVVAMVGTRLPTPQGVAWCEEFIEAIMPHHPLIVSGLALGIDATAHRKCIELGIPTVGVLGHGLGRIYPSQHRPLARKMLDNGGLLTEHISAALPDKDHFPMRNRIIAAMCDALVVVETDKKGGSMITAQFADAYNKDVFAVPGRVRDRMSQGCNFLIKTHRAALIQSAEDLAYVMRWDTSRKGQSNQISLFADLTTEEKIVVDLLTRYDMLSIDQLTYESQLAGSEMASVLLELEFKGKIRTLPGKRYMLA